MISLYNVLLRVAWSSTYTYILLLFAAATFVAYIARPKQRGEAVKALYAGVLLSEGPVTSGPVLHVRCLEGGKVLFERLGVAGLTSSGAVSLAVNVIGKDVEVLERVSPGYQNDAPMAGASFLVDMTGHEWRHVKWTDEDSGLWCAFSLHVRQGIDFTVPMRR